MDSDNNYAAVVKDKNNSDPVRMRTLKFIKDPSILIDVLNDKGNHEDIYKIADLMLKKLSDGELDIIDFEIDMIIRRHESRDTLRDAEGDALFQETFAEPARENKRAVKKNPWWRRKDWWVEHLWIPVVAGAVICIVIYFIR